ncbi:hypothetical protein [Actinoplanes sp. HUAS TT8]
MLPAFCSILAATDDGRHLYRTLGRTVRGALPAARVPEPQASGSSR